MKPIEQRFHTGAVEIRAVADGVSMISGYAAVFNSYSQDLGGFVERIAPTAFNRVLNRGDDVQAWFNHNHDYLLATRANGTLRLTVDEIGLRYDIDIDETDPDHMRVAAKIRRGDLRGSSFSFGVGKDGDDWGLTERDYPLRTVTNVSVLRDVGPVSTPAYLDTETVGALALRSLAERVGQNTDELRGRLVDILTERAGDVMVEAQEVSPVEASTPEPVAQEESTQPGEAPLAALEPVRRNWTNNQKLAEQMDWSSTTIKEGR